jgi:hypothetical protein
MKPDLVSEMLHFLVIKNCGRWIFLLFAGNVIGKHENKLCDFLSTQTNYADWATATFRRILVATFADRGVSRDQNGGLLRLLNTIF